MKEKFDSIFDVGKYDKCIDQIRKEIKFTREGKINPRFIFVINFYKKNPIQSKTCFYINCQVNLLVFKQYK